PFAYDLANVVVAEMGGLDHSPFFNANPVADSIFYIWDQGQYKQALYLNQMVGGWVYKKTAGTGSLYFPVLKYTPAPDKAADQDYLPPPQGARMPPSPPGAVDAQPGLGSGGSSGGGCFIGAMGE
ncbi:MAG: hypothetical protein V1742_01080, partial [Pseudomonadota bacterium]